MTKGLKVLSLFDGISCGMVALERSGIPVERYVAYEIDKDAIQVSESNYPMIEHRGSVVGADFSEFEGFDLLLGGSPCSYWSNARSNRGDKETTIDGFGGDLFIEYARAKKEVKPKFFIYENNHNISNEIVTYISETLGCFPRLLNSALVSAQHRKRFYWTNLDFLLMPQDRGIKIGDVIPDATQGAALRNQQQPDGRYESKINIRDDYKSNCLIAYMTERNNCVLTNDGEIRPLTAEEFEILQTLPVGYTGGQGERKRKQLIGNGWTVEMIAHILMSIKEELDEQENHQR